MFDKYSNLDENIKNRLDEFEKRINSYEIKITELSKLINVDKLIKEKNEKSEKNNYPMNIIFKKILLEVNKKK